MLSARREEIAWVQSKGVHESVPLQECKDASKKLLDLIWVDTDKVVNPVHKIIRSRLCAKEHKTKRQGKMQSTLLASPQLLCAIAPLEAVEALASIMMSVGWSRKETVEVETLRQQQSAFPRNSPETHRCPSSSKRSEILVKTKLANWSIACMEN